MAGSLYLNEWFSAVLGIAAVLICFHGRTPEERGMTVEFGQA